MVTLRLEYVLQYAYVLKCDTGSVKTLHVSLQTLNHLNLIIVLPFLIML